VLRAEQRCDPDTGFEQRIHKKPAVRKDTGVVRDESDPFPGEHETTIRDHAIRPRQDKRLCMGYRCTGEEEGGEDHDAGGS
jgi:hypothetical protein